MAKIYFIYKDIYFESEDNIAKSILDNATIITEKEYLAHLKEIETATQTVENYIEIDEPITEEEVK